MFNTSTVAHRCRRGASTPSLTNQSVHSAGADHDLLNVSRPFLVRLLEEGVIDHHKVGSHRRIRANDLLTYRAKREEERRAAMTELQRLSQEFDAD